MLQRDIDRALFDARESELPDPFPEPSRLPRFELREVDAGPQETTQSNSPSLAPVASDIEDEDWTPAPVSPAARRARATTLFATIVVPIGLLAVFEVVTLGADTFRGVIPAAQQHMVAAQSWGETLLVGNSEAHLAAVERPEAMTDDEARGAASTRLEQLMDLASNACAEEGMTPTTLWVTTTVTPDGRVASVAVEGATHGRHHVSSCVGGIARNLSIPAFRGEPVTASQKITLP